MGNFQTKSPVVLEEHSNKIINQYILHFLESFNDQYIKNQSEIIIPVNDVNGLVEIEYYEAIKFFCVGIQKKIDWAACVTYDYNGNQFINIHFVDYGWNQGDMGGF